MQLTADLVVYDEMSMMWYSNGHNIPIEYTTSTLIERALGGTEFQLLLLMDSYAKLGKRVICFNNNRTENISNNVQFIPRERLPEFNITTKNLVTSRYSNIPTSISFEKCFIWMHDIIMPRALIYDSLFRSSNKFKIIVPSEWSKSLFPSEWPVDVIHNMIPDWVYNVPINHSKKDYIYASAALKGLEHTLTFWNFAKSRGKLKNKKLKILNPGYDIPDKTEFENKNDLNFIGSIPFHEVVNEINKSECLFYVNRLPETFCIVAVLCEILNTPMHILTLEGDGALPEIINTPCVYHDYIKYVNLCDSPMKLKPANNYRLSHVLQTWLKHLK